MIVAGAYVIIINQFKQTWQKLKNREKYPWSIKPQNYIWCFRQNQRKLCALTAMKPRLWPADPVRKPVQDAARELRHRADAFSVRLPDRSVMRGPVMN